MIKRRLYGAGVIPLYHHLRNRDVLTVMMLHRVLPADDPRRRTTLADWTVEPRLFDDFLGFAAQHYNVVSLQDVLGSLDGARPLPSRSLLLTFDDGYADVEEYALPLLRRHGLPAALFVSSDAVGRRTRNWTEDFWFAFMHGELSPAEVEAVYRALHGGAASGGDLRAASSAIACRCGGLDEAEVDALLGLLDRPLVRIDEPAQMLSVEQLRRLRAGGVAIGTHGKTHVELTHTADLEAELRQPKRALAQMLQLASEDEIASVAFPFGTYTAEIVDRALAAGYRLAFSMRGAVQPAPRGWLDSPVVSRVNLHQPTFAPQGRFRPDLAALILSHAPYDASAMRGRASHGSRRRLDGRASREPVHVPRSGDA